MTSTLVTLGIFLIAAGIFFAVKGFGTAAAGGTATKGFSITGPSWLILVAIGVGVIIYGTIHDDQVRRERTARPLAVAVDTTPPETDSDGCFVDPVTNQVVCAVVGIPETGDTVGTEPIQVVNTDPTAFDPALDALWVPCEQGDMASCDTMFFESLTGSPYESFGMTCGDLVAAGEGTCVSRYGAVFDGATPIT